MTVTAIRKPKAKITVGGVIDAMCSKRDERRELEARDKVLKAEYDELEQQLMELMDKEGVTKSTGRTASAGLSASEQFSIKDWDAFTAYIGKNKYYHLLQRRVSVEAAREIFKMKGALPGLEPFTKRGIRLSSL